MNKKGFFSRGVQKLNSAYEKDLERRDPIYLEPLHKSAEPDVKPPVARGGIDVYFLIVVLTMSYNIMVMVRI